MLGPDDSERFHYLVRLLCEEGSGGIKAAQQLLHRMVNKEFNFSMSADDCSCFIMAFNRESLHEEVLNVGRHMVENGIYFTYLTAYTHLFNACTNGDCLDLGRKLHYLIRDRVQLNHYAFTSLLKMYGKGRDLAEVQMVYQQIRDMGVKPDLHLWCTLISAFGQCGQAEQAKTLFNEMQKEGVVPTVEIWNAVIFASSNTGEALKLFEQMRQKGLKPNVQTWNSLISLLGQHGDSTKAFEFFQKMQEEGVAPNLRTFASIISAMAKVGDYTQAYNIFSQIRKHGLKPDVVVVMCVLVFTV